MNETSALRDDARRGRASPGGASDAPLLRVAGLSCGRGDRILFRDLSFELCESQALQVSGANGTGKTTLLRAVCGLTLPLEGQVLWRGEASERDPQRFRADLVYVGHADGVKLELSARENLACSRALMTRPSAIPLVEVLGRLGLRGFEDVPARRLSAGQRRRVALARLLLGAVPLWLLDEPFTALDKASAAIVREVLEEHLRAGGTLIFSSHQEVGLSGSTMHELALE